MIKHPKGTVHVQIFGANEAVKPSVQSRRHGFVVLAGAQVLSDGRVSAGYRLPEAGK